MENERKKKKRRNIKWTDVVFEGSFITGSTQSEKISSFKKKTHGLSKISKNIQETVMIILQHGVGRQEVDTHTINGKKGKKKGKEIDREKKNN